MMDLEVEVLGYNQAIIDEKADSNTGNASSHVATIP